MRRYALLSLLIPTLATACGDDTEEGTGTTNGTTGGETDGQTTNTPTTLTTTPTTDPTTDPTGETTTGEPTTGTPTTGEPTTGEPTTGEPTTGEPTTGEPTSGTGTTGGDETGTTGEPTGTTGMASDCTQVTLSGDMQFFFPNGAYYIPPTVEPALGDEAAEEEMQIQFWANDTGMFDLASADVNDNYATCAQCLLLLEDLDGNGNATRLYFQSEGTLEMETAPILGAGDITLTGVRLVEVTIDQDLVSTPVPDGGCIDIVDATLTAPGVDGWTCSTAYYEDGVDCDCGCGIVDPDCGANPDIDTCDFCDNFGSCSENACPGDVDPNDVAVCQ